MNEEERPERRMPVEWFTDHGLPAVPMLNIVRAPIPDHVRKAIAERQAAEIRQHIVETAKEHERNVLDEVGRRVEAEMLFGTEAKLGALLQTGAILSSQYEAAMKLAADEEMRQLREEVYGKPMTNAEKTLAGWDTFGVEPGGTSEEEQRRAVGLHEHNWNTDGPLYLKRHEGPNRRERRAAERAKRKGKRR